MTDTPPDEVDITDWPVEKLDELALYVYANVEGTSPAPDAQPDDSVAPEHAVSDETNADVLYGA